MSFRGGECLLPFFKDCLVLSVFYLPYFKGFHTCWFCNICRIFDSPNWTKQMELVYPFIVEMLEVIQPRPFAWRDLHFHYTPIGNSPSRKMLSFWFQSKEHLRIIVSSFVVIIVQVFSLNAAKIANVDEKKKLDTFHRKFLFELLKNFSWQTRLRVKSLRKDSARKFAICRQNLAESFQHFLCIVTHSSVSLLFVHADKQTIHLALFVCSNAAADVESTFIDISCYRFLLLLANVLMNI